MLVSIGFGASLVGIADCLRRLEPLAGVWHRLAAEKSEPGAHKTN